jgi:hypothetical protein
MSITAFLILALIGSHLGVREYRVAPDSSFDSFGNLCFEDEKARLDNFAIALQQNPKLIGYIVVYAGKESCAGEAEYRANRAKRWVVKRGVAAGRIITKDGGYRADITTELQPWPSDQPPYEILPGELSFKHVKIFKPCKIYRPRKCPVG